MSGLSVPESVPDGVPPTPSLRGSIPASEALEMLLVCTYSTDSALSNDKNDDSVLDKVEKKFYARIFSIALAAVTRDRTYHV